MPFSQKFKKLAVLYAPMKDLDFFWERERQLERTTKVVRAEFFTRSLAVLLPEMHSARSGVENSARVIPMATVMKT